MTVSIILAILYHYVTLDYKKESTLLDLAYASILAGALSHAYERIFNGYVIDFILVKYFAILNLADILISI